MTDIAERWEHITVKEVNIGDCIWLREHGESGDLYAGVTGIVLGRNDSEPFMVGQGKRRTETVMVSLLIRQQDHTVVERTGLLGTVSCWRSVADIDADTDIT